MATTYPTGTPVLKIDNWDRSTKVAMICTNHPENGVWRTKQPLASAWFPSADGQELCDCRVGEFVTEEPYTNRP